MLGHLVFSWVATMEWSTEGESERQKAEDSVEGLVMTKANGWLVYLWVTKLDKLMDIESPTE